VPKILRVRTAKRKAPERGFDVFTLNSVFSSAVVLVRAAGGRQEQIRAMLVLEAVLLDELTSGNISEGYCRKAVIVLDSVLSECGDLGVGLSCVRGVCACCVDSDVCVQYTAAKASGHAGETPEDRAIHRIFVFTGERVKSSPRWTEKGKEG